jgi:protein-disulfide isomerase
MRDLDSDTVKARVQSDESEGENIGINATPTFFINGKAIVNPQSYDEFKAIIDQATQ